MERSDYQGAVYITGTAATPGKFGAIQALAEATLHGDTVCDYDGASVSGLVIPVGETIYGTFTSVKLTSGKVIAYRI